jgi:2,5-diketo-D-gluconate reductase B
MEYPKINIGTYRLFEKTSDSINYALSNGYRGIDTASLYKCENLIGDYLTKNEINRNEIWVTSKLNPKVMDLDESKIIESIYKTLSDLNMKYLDLFLIHCPNSNNIKCWNIIEKLKKQGIFKNIGVSNFDIKDLEEIKNFSSEPIFTNQIELSPFLKRNKLCEYMKENNIIISAHSSLAKGEKMNDPLLLRMADKYKKTPAQIMLQWALQNEYHIMPRSSDEKHIIDNININNQFKIDDIDMNELNNYDVVHITHPKYKFI